jgi:hypothetical protein
MFARLDTDYTIPTLHIGLQMETTHPRRLEIVPCKAEAHDERGFSTGLSWTSLPKLPKPSIQHPNEEH